MNIIETIVEESDVVEQAVNQAQPAVVEIDALALGLIVHAAVNVLNDYYDALNGSDAANTARVFPFTGGSRFQCRRSLRPTNNVCFSTILS